jgi:hypothetical protein
VGLKPFRKVFEPRLVFQSLDCALGGLFGSVHPDEEFRILALFTALARTKAAKRLSLMY